MSIKYLKVKIKSLVEEARIIKGEEQKLKKPRLVVANVSVNADNGHQLFTYTEASAAKVAKWKKRSEIGKARAANLINGLTSHRKVVVRNEARASLLAYAYLRHKPYSKTESPKTIGNKLASPPYDIAMKAVSIVFRHMLNEATAQNAACPNRDRLRSEFEQWLLV